MRKDESRKNQLEWLEQERRRKDAGRERRRRELADGDDGELDP